MLSTKFGVIAVAGVLAFLGWTGLLFTVQPSVQDAFVGSVALCVAVAVIVGAWALWPTKVEAKTYE